MTVSRVKEEISSIFEVFCIVEIKNGERIITSKYPESYNNDDILRNIPVFCFPISDMKSGKYFSFTITNNMEAMFSFGYCESHSPTKVVCIVSYFPWSYFFYSIVTMYHPGAHDLIPTLYHTPVPRPGPFKLKTSNKEVPLIVPDHSGLTSLRTSRNLEKLLERLNVRCIYVLYMALMLERRIILVSDSLDRVSASVYAARDLIYPLYWQHVFIPILPEALIDYVAAPMPLLVGIHRSLYPTAEKMWGEELVMVDLDNGELKVPPSLLNVDMLKVPHGIEECVVEGIKGVKKLFEHEESRKRIDDKLSRLSCATMVAIVGNYRGSCRFDTLKNTFSFDQDRFIASRPPNLQELVTMLIQCQHFDVFIQERLQIMQTLKKRDAYEELSVNYFQTGSNKNFLKTWVNDEIAKEWNPNMAMIQNGAFAFQGLLSDINSGTKVSGPQVMPMSNRKAPSKPTPWHQYKTTLTNLPEFLKDRSVPPPTIDDKIFNLLIGNLDEISSNPSIRSTPSTNLYSTTSAVEDTATSSPTPSRSASLIRRGPTVTRPRPPPRPVSMVGPPPGLPPGPPPAPSPGPPPPPPPPKRPSPPSSRQDPTVGQLISFDDEH